MEKTPLLTIKDNISSLCLSPDWDVLTAFCHEPTQKCLVRIAHMRMCKHTHTQSCTCLCIHMHYVSAALQILLLSML